MGNQTEGNPPSPSQEGTEGETRLIGRVALYAFLLNLGLGVMKGLLAFFSDSLAVTAGAIDSCTDAVASLVLYGGVKLSNRRTPSFPLGLYKIENLISVIVALSIFFAGYEILREVLSHGITGPDISLWVVLLLLVGLGATFLFGQYATRIGRTTESPTLIAEGRHRQADVLSSSVVLVSAFLEYFHWGFSLFGISIDRVAAVVVLIFIARAGWELLADGMRVLLDASMDFDTLEKVKKILENHPMVVGISSLLGRNAGRYRFLQASIIVRTGDLQKAHQISEGLESEIRSKVPHVERVIIHYEPKPLVHLRVAVPLSTSEGIISDHFGESPFFALLTFHQGDGLVEKQEVVENPHRSVETAKGIRVAEWLVGLKVDRVYMKEDLSAKGPGYVLGSAGIETRTTGARHLREIVSALSGD